MSLTPEKKILAYALVSAIRHPLLILGPDLRVISANPPFYNTFKLDQKNIEDKIIYEIDNNDWDIAALHKLFEELIKSSMLIDNYRIEHTFKSAGFKKLILNCSYIPSEDIGNFYFLSLEDTTYNPVEENQNFCDLRMNELLDAIPAAIYTTDEKGKITMFNKAAIDFAGRVPTIGVDSWCVTHKLFNIDGSFLPHEDCPMAVTLKTGKPVRGTEAIAERPDGTRVTFVPYPTPLFDINGNITGAVNMLVDISDRKVVENASQQLAAIVESSNDAILSLDTQGIVMTWNKGAENLSGIRAEDIIGKPISDIVPDEQLEFEKEIFNKVLKYKTTHHYDTVRPRPDGTKYNLLVTASPIKSKNNKIIGVSAIAHDITKRKSMEEALRKSEERYVLAEKATNDGLWDWNTLTGETYLSPRWKSLLGFSESELSNHIDSFFSSIHEEDLESLNEALESHFETDRPFNVEVRLKHKDGGYKWFRTRGQAMKNEEGQIYRMVGSTRNISYRKEKEELLKFSERRYRRIFEASQDGIIMIDFDSHRITDANPYILSMLSYDKEELIGKTLSDIGLNRSEHISSELKEKNYVYYDDLVIKKENNEFIYIEFIGNVYEEGGSSVIQCNIRDISERRRLEAVKETELLLSAEKLRTEFIADATHELRTPLAIIKGNVDLGLKAQKSNQSALKAIGVEVKHLSDLLSDLTILTTKDTKSERQLNLEKNNVQPIIESAVSRCRTLALKKNISLVVGEIPNVQILADILYLEKLFINIINNAIIYGNEGGNVFINVTEEGEDVTFTVRDDGIGISVDEIPLIFERFFRTDKARTGSGGGTGLGLAISKWIVESHGGKIRAESEGEMQGTTFTITLPKIK